MTARQGRNLANMSAHFDDAIGARLAAMGRAELEAAALSLHRVVKVAEERGEVVDAYVGATGANPRKGVYGCIDDVVHEMLDTAVTALCAVEHFQGNDGSTTLSMLLDHIDALAERVGVAEAEARPNASSGNQIEHVAVRTVNPPPTPEPTASTVSRDTLIDAAAKRAYEHDREHHGGPVPIHSTGRWESERPWVQDYYREQSARSLDSFIPLIADVIEAQKFGPGSGSTRQFDTGLSHAAHAVRSFGSESSRDAAPSEPRSMVWHEHCRHSACAEAIVSWVKRNGGEARYYPKWTGKRITAGIPARIAIRTSKGVEHAKPGDRIVMGDEMFEPGTSATLEALCTLREFTVSPVESTGSLG